jgi:hypothetical protein
MPDPASHSHSTQQPPENNEPRSLFDPLMGIGNSQTRSQSIAVPTRGSWSDYLAQLFLGVGLAVIAMLLGLIVWRIVHLPRSRHPAGNHPIAQTPRPAAMPEPEVVVAVNSGQEEPVRTQPTPLARTIKENQHIDAEMKEKVVDARPRLTETPTADQIFEQRLRASEDDLLGQLAAVPELRLLDDAMVRKARRAEAAAQALVTTNARDNQRAAEAFGRVNHKSIRAHFPREAVIAEQGLIGYQTSLHLHHQMRREALHAGLELQSGPKCKLAAETAAEMAELSKALRDLGFVSFPAMALMNRLASANPVAAGDLTSGKTKKFQVWCDQHHLEKYKGTMPTLIQMLQIEDEATRLLLVRELTRITKDGATTQLAGRALFDLSPKVRQAAIAGLEGRPSSEYVPILLRGLGYPWPPVADHAAVALRTLKPAETVAPLVDMLDLPSLSMPLRDANTNEYTVRELVRLDHLRNCLLCHVPSLDEEDGLVRGLVPMPGTSPLRSISSRIVSNYYDGPGDFVRADVTYLHQDFSVTLLDKYAGAWEHGRRFDFVTRLRIISPSERADMPASSIAYPQRDAVLYALRGLTGKDGGISSTRWREQLGLSSRGSEKTQDPSLDKISKPPKHRSETLEKSTFTTNGKDHEP